MSLSARVAAMRPPRKSVNGFGMRRFLRLCRLQPVYAVAGAIQTGPRLFGGDCGVKGEEYKDVLVVFDDVEAAWNNFSFTKTLTPNTSGAPTEGQYERSRKLAYVCFSRAEENLRILLFTPDPDAAKKELISNNLFEERQISIAG